MGDNVVVWPDGNYYYAVITQFHHLILSHKPSCWPDWCCSKNMTNQMLAAHINAHKCGNISTLLCYQVQWTKERRKRIFSAFLGGWPWRGCQTCYKAKPVMHGRVAWQTRVEFVQMKGWSGRHIEKPQILSLTEPDWRGFSHAWRRQWFQWESSIKR